MDISDVRRGRACDEAEAREVEVAETFSRSDVENEVDCKALGLFDIIDKPFSRANPFK